MIGTGSQVDPYIVNSWEELIEVAIEDDVYIEFDNNAEDKIIDVKDVAFGLSENLDIGDHTKINGNGWTIKNINANYLAGFISMVDSYSGGIGYVSNLNFVNIYGINTVFISKNIVMTNCIVSGMFYGNQTTYAFVEGSEFGNLINCSFNLEFYGRAILTQGSNDERARFNNCILKIDGKSLDESDYSHSTTTTYPICLMKNCKIVGKNPFLRFVFNEDSDNNVFDFISNTGIESDCSLARNNLINLNRLGPFVNISAGIRKVTTSQLIDSAYLGSIGFPIGINWVVINGELTNINFPSLTEFCMTKPYPFSLYRVEDGVILNKFQPQRIQFGAFANTNSLEKVTIPSTVKYLGKETFYNTQLEDVTIANDCEYFNTTFPSNCEVTFYEE